ncbi:hypothetical protein QM306_41215, partial [Burkholderia cenocepacia]|nr:hypothetical protein [Burkholderia cenocepacia]
TVAESLAAHPHLPVVCDPVLRAGGGGALGKGDVGFAMRERLLAEHLGTTPAAVADAFACGERPNVVLDRLRAKPGRTLRTLDPAVSPQFEALVPVSARLDPEQPIEPDRFIREFVPHEQHRTLTARF